MNPPLSLLAHLLRCVACGGRVIVEGSFGPSGYPDLGADGWLRCSGCDERYPVIAGTARMLDRTERSRISGEYPAAAIRRAPEDGSAEPGASAEAAVKRHTAESFTYEWRHFGAPRPEWRKNFLDYMQPHDAGFFRDLLVLDVGAGSGRHSAQAAALGARVVAIDIGRSIDVARRNVPDEVLTVQADAEHLPFGWQTFDFVMSIGVLHHLSDARRALSSLVHYAAPGGHVRIYLYWRPARRSHRAILRLVTAARRVTVRMPHGLLHRLCYPLSVLLWVTVVLPYRALRRRPRVARLAEALPLKAYADYPFGVLVNDQFDRFSAPLEQRFTRSEVETMLIDAGLTEVSVLPHHGWVGEGRVPPTGIESRAESSPLKPGISVVVPIRDDPNGAAVVIEALAAQTRPPDEVVIVNDGSVDETRTVLEERRGCPLPYHIIDTEGVGIAAARNLGIKLAHHEWIACTDAGCVPTPGWLEAIEEAGREADFVAGAVIVDAANLPERVLALSAFPRADERTNPSLWIRVSHRLFGRGPSGDRTGGGYMAFRHGVWESVGGFPPGLRASDDRAFSTLVARAGFRVVCAPSAAVHWRPRTTLRANLAMFFNYARGDVRIRPRRRHFIRVISYCVGSLVVRRGGPWTRAILGAGGVAYVWLPFHRARADCFPRCHWWRIPLVVMLKDLAQMLGAVMGLLDAALSRSADSRLDR